VAKYPFSDGSSIDAKIRAARAAGKSEDVCRIGDAEDIYYNLALSFIDKCPDRVLDTGCYQGAFTNRIALEKGARELVGVDASEEAISVARARYPQHQFISGDFEDIDLKGDFDYIYAMGWLHVKPDEGVARCLRQMRSLLRPDGRLIITGGYANWQEGRLERVRTMTTRYFDLMLEITYDKQIEYAPDACIRFSKRHFMWLLDARRSARSLAKHFMWLLRSGGERR
jgi:SAM-dependent methyltransferase